MYGLVNKAVEGMVCTAHGEATWLRIKAAAGVDVEGFVSNQPYPDEMTYRLVAAASEILNAPADEILRSFGEYWVLHTALAAYGPLMRASGRTLKEFLLHLPHFHTRVQAIYPELVPPSFSCSNVGERQLDLHYRTPRPAGLEPFVEGLVMGLGRMFETPVKVQVLEHRGEGADHSVFRVRWGAAIGDPA